jgi:SAM-dependent methyltransferase
MDQQLSNTDAWLDELLVCPACASKVNRFDDAFTCLSCRRHYPIRFGIPDFRIAPDPYISIPDEIRKIEGFSAPGRSFAETVKSYYELTPESPPSLHAHYVAAMDAAAVRGAALIKKLKERYPTSGNQRILDVGCGTAGLCIAATDQYQQVVGIDVALRWLVMGKIRLAEQGISVPLICANAEALPFRSGSFDAVVAIPCSSMFEAAHACGTKPSVFSIHTARISSPPTTVSASSPSRTCAY